MPDWYRGGKQDPADGIPPLVDFIKRESVWEKVAKDWQEKVKPYAEKDVDAPMRPLATGVTNW